MASLDRRHHHPAKWEGRSPLLRDPLQLVTDFLFLLFTLVYVPLRNLLRSFLQQPKSLKGKVCLVTGSGRGLGRELCLELAREGAIVACADINEDNNCITVHKLRDLGARVKGYKLNVANKEEVEAVVRQVEEDLGPVYLLVNNAAIIVPSSTLNEEYTRATFNVNTLGPIWMTMAVLPGMKSRNSGHIVNISSICGLYGTPVLITYAASKAALSNFSHSLRLELSFDPKNHIHVTCVHPDVINTSEDYVEMLNTRLSARDVRTVTADIMRAIKYNKTDVSSPSFYYYLYALNVLFPSEVIHKFIKLLDVTLTAPSQEELDKMPVSELVRSCRPPRDSEETMRLLAQDRPRHEHKARRISFTKLGHQVCEASNNNHCHQLPENPARELPKEPQPALPQQPKPDVPKEPEPHVPQQSEPAVPQQPEGAGPQQPEGAGPQQPEGAGPQQPEGAGLQQPEGAGPQQPDPAVPQQPEPTVSLTNGETRINGEANVGKEEIPPDSLPVQKNQGFDSSPPVPGRGFLGGGPVPGPALSTPLAAMVGLSVAPRVYPANLTTASYFSNSLSPRFHSSVGVEDEEAVTTPPPSPNTEPALETFSIRSLRESSDLDLARSIKTLRQVGLKTSASQVFSVGDTQPSSKELD